MVAFFGVLGSVVAIAGMLYIFIGACVGPAENLNQWKRR
jgi:hypothetical protein